MNVIDSITGQQVRLRNTKQFLDDVIYAVRFAKIKPADFKKFSNWYCGIYARLHIKRRDGVNMNEGCNLSKLVKFLAKKIPSGEWGSDLGHDLYMLQPEGNLSSLRYNDYFEILFNEDMKYLASGIKVKDWTTQNIKANREFITKVLTTVEQDKLRLTLVSDPWSHCSKETNWCLMEMLQEKLNQLCFLETGIKADVWIRKKPASGGSYQIVMIDRQLQEISKPLTAVPNSKAFGGHKEREAQGFANL